MSEFISPNIQINIRCQPLTTSEIENEEKLKVFIHDERNLSILLDGEQEKNFHFDKVFGPDSSQEEVFSSVRPLLHGILSGEKATVFHYGQVTAGKSYTVSGTEENPGLIPRSIHELFDLLQDQEKENSQAYQVSCQLFSLNEEQLTDVFQGSEILRREKVYKFAENNKVTVRHLKDHQLEIKNSSEIVVASAVEMLDIYRSGLDWLQWYTYRKGRLLNRETVIFLIRVKLPQCERDVEQDERKEGKIFFVDLTGSERGGRTKNGSPADGAFRGQTLRTLGEVLASINRSNRVIPYRNSKLTFLCSDSLTRTSKSVLFIHIKMSEKDISETLSSLRFGRSISRDIDQQPVKGVAETISKDNEVLSDERSIDHPSK